MKMSARPEVWKGECRRQRQRLPGAVSPALALAVACLFVHPNPGRADGRSLGLAAASLAVVQNDYLNTTNSVTVTPSLSLNDLRVRDGSTLGTVQVQVGDTPEDDVASGVMLSSVAELARVNYGTNAYPITAVHVGESYRVCGYVPTAQTAGSAARYNVNVSVAWFAYDRFLGGTARNAAGGNGATNNLFIGSPGLTLGSHFKGVTNGWSIVDLRGLGIDSRTDGVLLVNGAKDENNFALSQVNTTDGTWNVFVKDNATPTASAYEQDPVAFVFIPKTNTSLVSGRFNGNGSIAQFSGPAPAFTVTVLGTGRWALKIPGHSPRGGVLILSAEGGRTYNLDNIVSYQVNAAGDGWEIQSRDTPANGLQTPVGAEAVASFVFIPGVATLTLLGPQPNEQNLSTPTLKVGVTNLASSPVTVTLHGREAATPPPGPDFTMVVLPDSQNYAAEINGGKKEMWIAQSEWMITNRIARNLAYVAHLGDICQSGDLLSSGANNLTEWRNITNAMYRIENPARTLRQHGMPYGMAVGNHDQEPIGDPTGTTIFYNRYFGVSRFLGRDYYGGNYGTNNNNHFDLFSASGLDFIVLYFEYDPGANPAVLAWASEVLRTNAHRRIIAVTHYMGTAATPSSLSAQGGAIYNLLKTNANLFLLLGGHVCGSDNQGEGSRTDIYNGRTVHTLISDYQCRTNGGNGMLRLMEFSPSNNMVLVQTFSPWTGEYETDENSEFYFNYNLQRPGIPGAPGTPYVVLSTQTNTPPGNTNSHVWTGLPTERTFEWYVTVADALGNITTGPTWQFISASNLPPTVTNQPATIPGDAPSVLQLWASDPNGDAITFTTNSVPLRGIITDFDSTAGRVTYLPSRGYRGTDRFTFQASDGRLNSGAATLNLTIVPPPDANGNGLPDAWEAAYGVTDPNGDDDGDGQNNLAEYLANTNPTNAASVLRFMFAGVRSNGVVDLAWPSVGGTRYRIQYNNARPPTGITGVIYDIVRPFAVELDSGPYGVTHTQTFTDDFTLTGPATNGARYYRIKVIP